MKSIVELFKDLFEPKLPVITEESNLHDIASAYPNLYSFLERKYGIKPEPEDGASSLQTFVEKFKLPPSQIVFMEVQLDSRPTSIIQIGATEAKSLVQKEKKLEILDVREEWEWRYGSLPGAKALTPQLLDEVLSDWPKSKPILIYCHFGIRSLDAATFLADRGFKKVQVIKGGIDAWSQQADPSFPRYSGAYC